MAALQGIRILQINLGRDRAAHDLAFATAAEKNADLVVVCEPNKKIAKGRGWIVDDNLDVGVYFRNKNIKVKEVTRRRGFLAVGFQGYTLLSCYVSPNIPKEAYESKIDEIMEFGGTREQLLLAGDFNAKSQLWGSPFTDGRGEYLGEWLATRDITIQNDGMRPTFIRGNSQSYIDLTAATSGITGLIRRWEVLENETATYHQYIWFEVAGERTRQDLFFWRARDWVTFRTLFRRKMEEEEARPSNTFRGLIEAIKSAYNGCLGPRQGNTNKMPYWWSDSIHELRKGCLNTRRRLKRESRIREELVQELRTRKRELKKAIKKAKETHWERLCAELQGNPWGDAYRIVMKRTCQNNYELDTNRREEIASELFPITREEDVAKQTTQIYSSFTREELERALRSLKKGRATGIDGIPPEAVKIAGEMADDWMLKAYNGLLQEQSFPNCWKIARLVLIPKGRTEENKFRPICLLNAISKVYESLIRNRLEEEVERGGGLSPRQFGFRKGKSTIDAICMMVDVPRNVKWATVITLDVKNAFNTLPWGHINRELERKGITQSLRNVIQDYLRGRRIQINPGGTREVTAGVPQGSVLGPLLWNIAFDGVLRMRWPEGTIVVGYADDLAVLVRAERQRDLVRRAEETCERIDAWIREKGLQLAPMKTEAVMIRGPRNRNDVVFRLGDTEISPKRAIKYLGVWIDDVGTFGRHVIEVTKKAEGTAAALARLMPNLGGPKYSKRRILAEVVTSTLLYAAPAWEYALRIQRYANMLTRCQRRSLLRTTCAYRTVSDAALQVIAGSVPIVLLAHERARLYNRPDRATLTAKREERERTIEEWQRCWGENQAKGQWTKTLIPPHRLKEWITCKYKDISYFMTQAFSGHGSFRAYTHRIGKAEDVNCVYCGNTDTALHTIFECGRWTDARTAIEAELGERLRPGNLAVLMIQAERKWSSIANFLNSVMREKESEERRLQQAEP